LTADQWLLSPAATTSFLVTRAATLAAVLALGGSSSIARGLLPPKPRSVDHAGQRQRSQPTVPGLAVIIAVTATQLRVSGIPLDEFGVPFAVHSTRGIRLSIASADMFADKQLCSQRPSFCSQRGFPPTQQWFPISGAFLRPHDRVILILGVSAQTAAADYRSGKPAPVSSLYDVG
jgi:hypothetical protein